MRRALGYKLESQGQLLARFVDFLEGADARTVTIELAVAWATDPAGADPVWWSKRLSVARQFARYLQTLDPDCEMLPARLLPYRVRRATPYLYGPEEIAALMSAAGRLRSPPQAVTYQTLIGLLAVAGLRVGEAIRLDRDDVDVDHSLLRIINSKYGKSREVPLHASAMHALHRYAERRAELCPRPGCEAFFLSTAGTRLHAANVRRVFTGLGLAVGLAPRSARCRPTLHSFRHSFAVRSLLEWHREGVDVQAQLPRLSTYMGHVEPSSTYHYLSAAPELLQLVARRLEPTMEGLS
jgi:integrase